jgi:hypothetical protein
VTVVQFYYNHALAIALGFLMLGQNAVAQVSRTSVDLASSNITSYLNDLAEVTCTEQVSQVKFAPNGKIDFHQESTFDYLVMMDGSQDEFTLNESRLPKQQGATSSKNLPLLVTNGFSTLFLIFHPYYRDAFVLTPEADVVEDGQKLSRIHFEHLRGKRTPVALAVRGREYPLDITGDAWVDAETGAVVRIESGLAAPMEDIGLRMLHIQINYSSMRLPGSEQTMRYPASAYVEVETKKQHWRNIHLFTNYKRFGVSTEVAVSEKKQ